MPCLAERQALTRALIASAIPGVLITDERGTVTNVSQSFGTMFGLDEPLAGPQLAGTQGAAVLRRVAREFADPVRFEVIHTADPVVALRLATDEHWDLLVTDLDMPGMTGLELLGALR